MKQKIILASASKRRAKILDEAGIKYTISISNANEINNSAKTPEENAIYNAVLKAKTVQKKFKNSFIIGADTFVYFNNNLIGKPETIKEAKEMLNSFSNNKLEVYSGVCIINTETEQQVTQAAKTIVRVRKLNKKTINQIIKKLDPLDRAGGFSIEGIGSYIFDNINGSFYNVLGLPMTTLYDLFTELGIDLLYNIDESSQH